MSRHMRNKNHGKEQDGEAQTTTTDTMWTKTDRASCKPVVGMKRSFPKVGVDAALCDVIEEREEELSARARGAKGGGLPETGGLNGRL